MTIRAEVRGETVVGDTRFVFVMFEVPAGEEGWSEPTVQYKGPVLECRDCEFPVSEGDHAGHIFGAAS